MKKYIVRLTDEDRQKLQEVLIEIGCVKEGVVGRMH